MASMSFSRYVVTLPVAFVDQQRLFNQLFACCDKAMTVSDLALSDDDHDVRQMLALTRGVRCGIEGIENQNLLPPGLARKRYTEFSQKEMIEVADLTQSPDKMPRIAQPGDPLPALGCSTLLFNFHAPGMSGKPGRFYNPDECEFAMGYTTPKVPSTQKFASADYTSGSVWQHMRESLQSRGKSEVEARAEITGQRFAFCGNGMDTMSAMAFMAFVFGHTLLREDVNRWDPRQMPTCFKENSEDGGELEEHDNDEAEPIKKPPNPFAKKRPIEPPNPFAKIPSKKRSVASPIGSAKTPAGEWI